MTDEKDHESAARIMNQAVSLTVRACIQAAAPETHPSFNGLDCVICGEEIPAKRLEMGRMRCVECQTDFEKRVRR